MASGASRKGPSGGHPNQSQFARSALAGRIAAVDRMTPAYTGNEPFWTNPVTRADVTPSPRRVAT